MKLGIVAGGPEQLVPALGTRQYADYQWIGADHGTIVLLNNGIRPLKAFGDFDSLTAAERTRIENSGVRLSVYPAEKDKTDLELALDWALQQNPDDCVLFGVTGGRLDHGLAAVQLLMKSVGRHTHMSIVDKKNSITLLTPNTYSIKNDLSYRYLSFLALTENVTGLTLSGVKYPLSDAELPLGSSLCISNEPAADLFTVSFTRGCLLMMRCSD